MVFKPLKTCEEWRWINARTHAIYCEDTQGILALDGQGRILAAAAFDSWTVDACSVHMAIDKPIVLRHGFLSEIARYLFVESHRERIFGLVPTDNDKALKLNAHMGWREVARVDDAVATGVGYVVMRMDKADCRWISQNPFKQARCARTNTESEAA